MDKDKNKFPTGLPEFVKWVDPEQEKREEKNAVRVAWGLGIGINLWLILGLLGSPGIGFVLFFVSLFVSFWTMEN